MRPFVAPAMTAVLLFSLLMASCSDRPGAEAARLCPKHHVDEKFCTICRPEIKKDPNILLCKEHGDIPEDICTACHPELKAKYSTCPHELPPAFCSSCAK